MSRINIIVGAQNTGKSTLINQIIEASAKKYNRRSLVIDPGRAAAYDAHGFIREDQIPLFVDSSHGAIKRISNVANKKRLLETIYGVDRESNTIDMSRAFTEANLVMEDAKSYVNDAPTERLLECIKACKQYGLTLILSYHAIKEIAPAIMDMQPHDIFIKKTGDEHHVFSRIKKGRSLGKYAELQDAFYTSKFHCMTPKEILDSMPRDDFWKIIQDLGYESPQKGKTKATIDKEYMDAAKWLCKRYNGGKVTFTKPQTEVRQYHWEYVQLRDL